MRFRILLVVLICCITQVAGQSKWKKYQYHIDLVETVDDRVFVSLNVPKIKSREVLFCMPKIVPGTYAIADYGRYVKNFVAYDKQGKNLPVEKIDENVWKINATKRIDRITYWVDDTYDSPVEGPEIFWPAGTNIEEGKDFLLNTSGFFGYIKGMTKIPFEISITRPFDFYGSTGMTAVKTNLAAIDDTGHSDPDKATDVFRTLDYDELIDSPIMYNKPDTAVVKVANAEVLIGSYSPNSIISAKQIAESIREVLQAQSAFLGGKLPVNKYAFIFYFTDQEVSNDGALEHSYSSVYFMPEASIGQLKQQLRDVAAHEFLHILTPLTIHSHEIANFDYNDPKMSKHLWMYEGVTEYFASLVQVKYGLITPEQYMNVLYNKMVTADEFINNVPFTDISRYTLNKYHDQYYNVYQKGMLIALCLDLKLRQLSNGTYGLRDLMLSLSEKFGKSKPFNDEELFGVITELTYPQIKEFFDRYVQGPEPLPIQELFESIGIKYKQEERYLDYSLGINNTDLDITQLEGKPRLFIAQADRMNEMGKSLGFKSGDILLAINDESIPDLGPELRTFFTRQAKALVDLKTLTYKVLRKNEGDVWQEVLLVASIKPIEMTRRHIMIPDPNATAEQIALRKTWIK